MPGNARIALLALASIGMAAALPAAAATAHDPLGLFKKYIERPIERALAVKPRPSTKAKPKVVQASVIGAVPRPRARPELSVAAGLATFAPITVSVGASGWPATLAVATEPLSPEVRKPDVAPVLVPRLKPASAKAPLQLASLPPKPEAPRLPSAALAALGIGSMPLATIREGDCGIVDPVAVASLDSGAVSLLTKAILDEQMATTLALWVQKDVIPAAANILKADLTGLRIAASYDCRSRDNISGAPLSEHAFGNAIDIGAFRVDKRWIAVGDKSLTAADDRFLDAIRAAACQRFTTVLGPGEPYHDTHFHLDLARHGKSGTYRICQ